MSILSETEFFQLFPENPTSLPATSVAYPKTHWPSGSDYSESLTESSFSSGWFIQDSENEQRRGSDSESSTVPSASDSRDTVWIKDLVEDDDSDKEYVLIFCVATFYEHLPLQIQNQENSESAAQQQVQAQSHPAAREEENSSPGRAVTRRPGAVVGCKRKLLSEIHRRTKSVAVSMHPVFECWPGKILYKNWGHEKAFKV